MRGAGWRRTASGPVFLLLFGAAAHAADDERPAATPYRPTVSTPAALSAPGWLELEAGGLALHDRIPGDEPHDRYSLPYSLKYAFTDDWGLRVGGEGVVRTDGGGQRASGGGDTGIVLKRRFAIDDAQALGLEAGALYPTAKPRLQLGSGKPDYSANGIYSADFAGWHADVNVVETRFGSHGDDTSRWQTLGALALAHPISERWAGALEWSGARQTAARGLAQILGAVSFSLRRWAVLDFGAAAGVNRATPRWQAFGGATVVLGRLD